MDIKGRIKQYIDAKGISTNMLETTIGISSGGFRKVKTVSSEFVSEFAKKYPSVSLDWLLRGEGEMEKSVPQKSFTTGRPYYDVDFLGGFDLTAPDQTKNPEYNIDFKPYNKDGVIWCNITGRSMEPEINSGDIIALSEVVNWDKFILMNDIYAIITKNNLRTVKRVKSGSDKNHFKLVPSNPEFEIQEIEIAMIDKVFKVLGCMKKL